MCSFEATCAIFKVVYNQLNKTLDKEHKQYLFL